LSISQTRLVPFTKDSLQSYEHKSRYIMNLMLKYVYHIIRNNVSPSR